MKMQTSQYGISKENKHTIEAIDITEQLNDKIAKTKYLLSTLDL
jgi:hypothetical protein